MNNNRTRRPSDPRLAAEQAFKTATTKPAELPPKQPSIPNSKEQVTLRIDRDVLDHFQEDGPGLAGPHQCGVAQGRGVVTDLVQAHSRTSS